MIIALKDIILFVTAFVSFLHGTRIAWACGKECNSRKTPEERIGKMKELIPVSFFLYFFGFAITSNYIYEVFLEIPPEELGSLAIIFMSLINAFLASNGVAWLAMPKRRRIF
jgi:hypothetical protein